MKMGGLSRHRLIFETKHIRRYVLNNEHFFKKYIFQTQAVLKIFHYPRILHIKYGYFKEKNYL